MIDSVVVVLFFLVRTLSRSPLSCLLQMCHSTCYPERQTFPRLLLKARSVVEELPTCLAPLEPQVTVMDQCGQREVLLDEGGLEASGLMVLEAAVAAV